MATITLRLSAKTDKATSQHEILIRFRHGKVDQYGATNVFVHPDYWNAEAQIITLDEVEAQLDKCRKWRIITPEKKQHKDELERLKQELQSKVNRLDLLTELVQTSFQNINKNDVPKDWLKSLLQGFNFPTTTANAEAKEGQQISFFDEYNRYIDTHKFSDHRRRQNRVIWRTLKRFEVFKGLSMTFDNITADTLRAFEQFLVDEHTLVDNKKYKKVLAAIPESRTPKPRGKNTINDFMIRLRSFFIWANDNDLTHNNPFKHYQVAECVYGTPYYITIDERNQLYHADFGDNTDLARQRDIFVFQCLIGCRVSDLWALTKNNLVNGAIEYIPRKTKEGRAITVRVPLNAIATEIIERYKDTPGDKLFQYTTQQQYNRDIKKMFKRAGLTRIVTIINPTTREEEQHPICDIASSHLARRCFVGNLYKKVKDPNLIGKLSGHKEGSRAFTRYRDIDEETSKELVTMLE